jgi:hypothetical protein
MSIDYTYTRGVFYSRFEKNEEGLYRIDKEYLRKKYGFFLKMTGKITF